MSDRLARRLPGALLDHPGRWLLAALVLDLGMYALSTREYAQDQGPTPWILLDLFLFWRVWRGGTKARSVLIFLGLLGITLSTFVMVAGLFDDTFTGGIGWPALLCAIGSLLCLLVPALDPQEQPFGPTGVPTASRDVRAAGPGEG